MENISVYKVILMVICSSVLIYSLKNGFQRSNIKDSTKNVFYNLIFSRMIEHGFHFTMSNVQRNWKTI